MDLVASGAAAPTWLGYLIAAIELFGGLAILFGIKTRWVACALVAWVVIATALGHPFWTMEGAARAVAATRPRRRVRQAIPAVRW